jgi:hypothetical protein
VGGFRCSGKVGRSCSTSGTRRVNQVTNPVISHEWGKDREVLTTSGTYLWSFVTQITDSNIRYKKDFKMLLKTHNIWEKKTLILNILMNKKKKCMPCLYLYQYLCIKVILRYPCLKPGDRSFCLIKIFQMSWSFLLSDFLVSSRHFCR